MSCDGLLLTQQLRQGRQGLEYHYWLRTEQGPLHYRVDGQRAVYFYLRSQRQQVKDLLSELELSGWQQQPVELCSPQGEPVDALYLSQLESYYRSREQLQRFGVTLFEEDVRPSERFLMERFICGSLKLDGEPQRHRRGYLELGDVKVAPCDYRPPLRLLSFDIETTMRADRLFSIGLYGIEDGQQRLARVLICGPPQTDGESDPLIRYLPDERSLLHAFVDQVTQFDPDMLIGWNLIDFDLRVLQRKAEQLGSRLRLGRDGSALLFRDTEQGAMRPRVQITGRVVVDGIDCLKGATYQFDSYALDAVAHQLLGRGKKLDDGVDSDQRGQEIARMYHQDHRALAAYNLEDCKLVWQIFEQAKLLDYLLERSRLTGLALDRVGGSQAAFDHLYLPRLHRAGRVAPSYASGEAGMDSPGGYVMDSRPGLYQQVLVLDFKSLYPSLIRTFLIDPLGLYEGLDEAEENTVPGFNQARFDRARHILPGLLETLWQARDQAKAEHNEALQRAIKIIMNSFYGVLGSDQCRFFDHRLSGSITLRGHQVLKQSRDFIESLSDESIAYTVIYGDTDSLFVWLKSAEKGAGWLDDSRVRGCGRWLAERLNDWWRQRLEQEFGLHSFLEIEFETHYRRFLMPTIRGSDKGSKKRYAGLIQGEDGSQQMQFKGLEAVRSDWTELAGEFQQQLYQRVFTDQPYREFVRSEVMALLAGKRDHQLVYHKRLRRPLADYTKNQPPQVQAARLEERWRENQGLPPKHRPGSRVSYLVTTQGPQPLAHCTASIDYGHYLEKQLQPVADAILPFVGTSFSELAGQQLALF